MKYEDPPPAQLQVDNNKLSAADSGLGWIQRILTATLCKQTNKQTCDANDHNHGQFQMILMVTFQKSPSFANKPTNLVILYTKPLLFCRSFN